MLSFRILGTLEAFADGRPVELRRGKVRAVLAFLLLNANEVIAADRLIDAVWGLDAPETARNNLQVYVSRLRKAFGSAEIPMTQPPGYLLRIEPAQLDLHRFEGLTERGSEAFRGGDPAAAAEILRDALALWRGPALADFVEEPFAETAAARLEELRVTALEDRIEAELALGRHAHLIGELEELVGTHPRRERLRGQLMLALYRSGRQAEALEAFQETRRALIEGLGIEPSPALQRLFKAILRQDPELAGRTAPVDGRARRDAARLESAAQRAYERGDASAAARLLSKCIELIPAHDPAHLELLPDLAEALRDIGDYERSEAVVSEAISAANEAGLEEVSWYARLVRLSLRITVDPGVRLEVAQREMEEAIEAFARAGDERGLARAWYARAAIPWRLGRAGEAVDVLERSREHARRAGDERTQIRGAILLLGAALVGPTPAKAGIRLCEAALDAHGDRPRVVGAALRALAGFRAMEGDFEEARALIERDRPILQELALTVHAAYVSDIYAGVEFLADDAAAAEREVRSGYDTLAALGEKTGLSSLAAVLAEALYLQGRTDETMHFTEVSRQAAAAQDFTAQIQWRGPRAKVLADRGSATDAERLAKEAVALAERTDWLNLRGNALCDLGHVLSVAGQAREASEVYERARRLYERKGNLVAARRAGRQHPVAASPG